jgi:hypothetical protein
MSRYPSDEIVGDKNRAAFLDACYKSGYAFSPREEDIALRFWQAGRRHEIQGVQKPSFIYFNPIPRLPAKS